MIIKTADLEGAALDWAVAKAIKLPQQPDISRDCITPFIDSETRSLTEPNIEPFKPSTKWNHGGPLIEQYIKAIFCSADNIWYAFVADDSGVGDYYIDSYIHDARSSGSTELIAAMRAIVEIKLGASVDIPQELTQ